MNLPTNIALFARIVFKAVSINQMFFNWTFFIAHWFFIISGMSANATYSKVLHAIHPSLPMLQSLLKRDLLFYKYKYMVLYEKLTKGPKFGTSLGPGPVISNAVMFEV